MKLHTAVCAAVIALCLPATANAVTLVDANGQPIGGQFQQWANEANVPTLAGDLTVIVGTGYCGGAPACSESPNAIAIDTDGRLFQDLSSPTETFLDPNAQSWDLDWELGHQFDWAELTDMQRGQFAVIWNSSLAWWDSVQSLIDYQEDGLEAVFADVYAACATGYTPASLLNWNAAAPQLTQDQVLQTCRLIYQIGKADGMDMPPAGSAAYLPHQPKPQPQKPKKHHKKHHPSHHGLARGSG